MIIKTEKDLEGLKRVGVVVRETIQAMRAATVPGITTLELDAIGQKILESHGAQSAPKLTYNFPGYTCISVNEEVAHGVPSGKILLDDDIINIDVSAELDGYWADSGVSFSLKPSFKAKKLLDATQQTLRYVITHLRVGQPISSIGSNIQKSSKKYNVIKQLTSHGVGSALHEYPDHILPYYDPKEVRIIEEGMVITVEPFLTTIGDHVVQRGEWALVNPYHGAINAQYEHTVVVTGKGPVILT